MPELPEVEVVRVGLQAHVAGRTIREAEVLHPRAIRRHVLGADDFTNRLIGARVEAARRRGKYLWLELSDKEAVVAHLGMSGQMLVQPESAPDEKHLRVRLRFDDDGPELRFVDQRTFGGLVLDDLTDIGERVLLPGSIAHIARDPMDPAFDLDTAVKALRSRRTEIKRALLDQTLVSGIGNIYADEALWRAKLHWARPTEKLTLAKCRELLAAASDVMNAALGQGGTSFDALYVNVNGQSGYFDRSLDAYGQEGLPCHRCGSPIRREPFMNRSSFTCPRCQPRPRVNSR
ncbi:MULTISPECIES: bifunctional DNA-formamidopyrimidine glycosylase/DNA-(apurinic or apyrimidinic site) lyase [unclassified Amycolatopsis]|uniref:bifunctional DNA-formamidopyrimidine glycosylase/DNA-(apurinic or apyrimidinic site) lyase n=1 Tax=unclassified Amycolatopsis TaxID=2618356 RepID=UPI002E2193C2|nr:MULTISPECIES: bifunctional DNA-formamidopyrimidine glycosylase/DNA-(apurinic or apyrimidinic site) lyase [unclassified Amycolatopsis]